MKINPLAGIFGVAAAALICVQVVFWGAIVTAVVCGAIWVAHHALK